MQYNSPKFFSPLRRDEWFLLVPNQGSVLSLLLIASLHHSIEAFICLPLKNRQFMLHGFTESMGYFHSQLRVEQHDSYLHCSCISLQLSCKKNVQGICPVFDTLVIYFKFYFEEHTGSHLCTFIIASFVMLEET